MRSASGGGEVLNPRLAKPAGLAPFAAKSWVSRKLESQWGNVPYCAPGVGCKIYESRPVECRTFMCMWLLNNNLGAEWKPDRSKLVVTNGRDGKGLEVRCDPGFPQAWRKEPYHSQILEWADAAKPHGVIICVTNRVTLVAREGEFPLGEVTDDDQIDANFPASGLSQPGCQGQSPLVIGRRITVAPLSRLARGLLYAMNFIEESIRVAMEA